MTRTAARSGADDRSNGEKVIYINLGTMTDVPQTVCQPDKQASQAVPIQTGCPSTTVEGDGLIEHRPVSEAQYRPWSCGRMRMRRWAFETSNTSATNFSCDGQNGKHLRTSDRLGLGALLGRQVLEVTPLTELSTTSRGGRSGETTTPNLPTAVC